MVEKFSLFSATFAGVISLVEKFALFPRTFFNVISMVEKFMLFPRTFTGVIVLVEKSTLFRRTFFDVISMFEKSTFFRCNLSGRNLQGFFTYFFQRNDGQKFDVVCGKLKASVNTREGFSCVGNFKQLTFPRLFSLNFSSKSPWCSPVSLKPESYNIHHCKQNC